MRFFSLYYGSELNFVRSSGKVWIASGQQRSSVQSNGCVSISYFVLSLSFTIFVLADWMMFSAASTGDQNTINMMLNQLNSFASASINNSPFSTMYDPTTAKVNGGLNRCVLFTWSFIMCLRKFSPGQGAMFSLLTLKYVSKNFQPFNGLVLNATQQMQTTN